jgi:parallel beta-helix repeat protein
MIRPTLIFCLLWPGMAAALNIEQPTVWRGELRFSETVRVAPGASLTVEPGTTVHFSGGALEVAGRLEAKQARFTGANWQGIVLKGVDGDTRLTGCVIDGADTGVEAIGGAPRLERLHLRGNRIGAQLGKKSAAVLSDSRIEENSRAGLIVKDGAAPTLTGNLFSGNGLFGAYVVQAKPLTFRDNRFESQPTGLKIANLGSDPEIIGNHFEKNEIAILVDKAARPTLAGNILTDNGTALHLYRRADARVTGNRFADNKIAILAEYSSYPKIVGNDFSGNERSLKLAFQSSAWEATNGAAARAQESRQGVFGQGKRPDDGEHRWPSAPTEGVIDARDNWWGRDGTEELATAAGKDNPSFILDGRDTPTFRDGGKDYPLDRVLFSPWRDRAATGEFSP